MGGLILFVLRPGMIEVGELVKGLPAVSFCGSDEVRLRAPTRRKFAQSLHPREAWRRRVTIAQASSAGKLLDAGVNHTAPEPVLETLMEVPNLPQLLLDPTVFDPRLELT